VRLSRSSAIVVAPDSDVLRIIATIEPSESLLFDFGGWSGAFTVAAGEEGRPFSWIGCDAEVEFDDSRRSS
jgi:hypothetical protein